MEQRLEKSIDNFLESISSQLYIGGIVLGIILIILGIIILTLNSTKKASKTIGWICLGVGIFSVLSSILQFFY